MPPFYGWAEGFGANVTLGEAIRDAIRYEMNRAPDFLLLVKMFSMVEPETGIMGLGLSSAALKLRPLLCMSKIDFMMVAFDEALNQASKYRYMFGGKVELPMVMQAYAFGAGTPKLYDFLHDNPQCHRL